MLIPAEQRFPDLKGKLDLFANATHAVIAKFLHMLKADWRRNARKAVGTERKAGPPPPRGPRFSKSRLACERLMWEYSTA
jgi:hypothetical protein